MLTQVVRFKEVMNTEKTLNSPSQAAEASNAPKRDASIQRRLSSDELLDGRRELVIEHSGEEYRLRITSKGKLILTK